jgi:hypothetical protein
MSVHWEKKYMDWHSLLPVAKKKNYVTIIQRAYFILFLGIRKSKIFNISYFTLLKISKKLLSQEPPMLA